MDEVVPVELVAGPMTLRCWRVDDAPRLAELVAANVDHLRPWMPWIATEPLPLAESMPYVVTQSGRQQLARRAGAWW